MSNKLGASHISNFKGRVAETHNLKPCEKLINEVNRTNKRSLPTIKRGTKRGIEFNIYINNEYKSIT
jgi:hypothetical protein